MGSKGTGNLSEMEQFVEIRQLLEELRGEDACLTLKELKINGNDLMALGFQGKAIGQCLQELLSLVLDEKLPNTREELLEYAKTQQKGR